MRKSASQDTTEMSQTIVLNDSEIEGDIILPGNLCLFGCGGDWKYLLSGIRDRRGGRRERGGLFFDD